MIAVEARKSGINTFNGLMAEVLEDYVSVA
jgi:hypothetical protein